MWNPNCWASCMYFGARFSMSSTDPEEKTWRIGWMFDVNIGLCENRLPPNWWLINVDHYIDHDISLWWLTNFGVPLIFRHTHVVKRNQDEKDGTSRHISVRIQWKSRLRANKDSWGPDRIMPWQCLGCTAGGTDQSDMNISIYLCIYYKFVYIS